MTERVYNFNPGPAVLPLPVLEQAREELLNYAGTGMSILEMSHRSREVEGLFVETENLCKELLGLGDDHRVLFLQGGASLQFAMVPLNFLPRDGVADYLITGSFAEKAFQEAQKVGKANAAGTTRGENFRRVLRAEEICLSERPAYVHLTSNNTIYGTQWPTFPDFGDLPLVADMSSDILSRVINAPKFALIYAGAQKNLGPAGVTVVIIRRDLLEKVPPGLPSMLRYDVLAKENSLYNTPPVFAVYLVNLVLKWVQAGGGLPSMEARNREKASIVYDAIDNSGGFYRGHAEKESRSLMNVTFRLPGEELERLFAAEAEKAGLVGLKGHRSVGGMRASLYNAMSQQGCRALAEFMTDFARRHG